MPIQSDPERCQPVQLQRQNRDDVVNCSVSGQICDKGACDYIHINELIPLHSSSIAGKQWPKEILCWLEF